MGIDRNGRERKKRENKRKRKDAEKAEEAEPKRDKPGEAKEVRFTQAEWEAKAKETAEKKAAEFEAGMKAWTEKSGQAIVSKQELEQLKAMRRTMLDRDATKDQSTPGEYEWQRLSGKK